MKKTILFNPYLFNVGVMVSLLFWSACSSPRLSQQVNQPEASKPAVTPAAISTDIQMAQLADAPQVTQPATAAEDALMASISSNTGQEVAAAASRNPVSAMEASTRETAEAAKALSDYAASIKKESQAKKGIKNKLAAIPVKMALKNAIKKIEKVEKSFDVKKAEKGKAGKAIDPTVRTGIIIAALGLILIIIAGIIGGGGSGLIYSIGGIALTVGLVVILLAALDVI